MDNTIKLMESIDYFHETIKSIDSNNKFNIHAEHGNWTIKNTENGWAFGTTDAEMAYKHLDALKADTNHLHVLVEDIICMQAIVLKDQINDLEKLVGKEAIELKEQQVEEFAQSMKEGIKGLFQPKLTVVK